ncbi:hypothetical protein BGZ80_006419 [Entomortierella chlamydospora]|uniref:Uncharacterized protein n=1 Tax=Entomortierella chlamydospora TaxID=101097 RepID=A0A9P6T1Y1_9FUNG|nr:hypothetical protein BGZ80_006419 [Entomortierella chlamydospora]
MRNPFSDFAALERRNIIIYLVGIMLHKFGLEVFTGSITLLATDRFKESTFENLIILHGLNQAFQCKVPLDGKARSGSWSPYILFPVYNIIGICRGMVELIRRVIPKDIVGGDVIKLKRMDATVHIFYEIAGTAGAFFASYLVLTLGTAPAPAMSPFFFVFAAVTWPFIGLLQSDHDNRKQPHILEQPSIVTQIIHGFAHFGTSMFRGAQIIFSSRKFIWLIPGYSIPLFTHRYLESQLSPVFAKRILNQGAYAQFMVGSSNFGELLGALFIRPPFPWLRLDALGLLIVWILPYSYSAKEDALSFAWTLSAIWIPVSFGWAAGDVSLAAYIQSALAMLYAVLGVVLGKVVDTANAKGDIHPALVYVGGVMYIVVCVVLLVPTFIPKGSFSLNPDIIDDVEVRDEDEFDVETTYNSELKGADLDIKK